MELSEEKIQKVLIRTLKKFSIPERDYSFGEYVEEAICMEKLGLAWIVYDGEKGKKHNEITHINCKSACLDLINRIAGNTNKEKKMKDYFDMLCKKAEE